MADRNCGAIEVESEKSEWVQAHEALSRLARERARADAEEGRCLLGALRTAAHVHLGFGSFGEYVERLFGYRPRSTQEKLRVAEALEELPAVSAALEGGALHWSAVRELTRVAVADTEREWLEVACGKTVHQLEALVAGKIPGDRPSSSANADARRHVLRFEVAAETLCVFREAISQLRRRSGAQLDDDSALMLMARHVLTGPSDSGRASYQIALSVCPECAQGRQQASGELVPVGAEIVAMAQCDGQQLGRLLAPLKESAAGNEAAHTGVRSEAGNEDANTGARSEAGNEDTHAGARSEAGNERAHTGVRSEANAKGPNGARAKQTIPPATRRAVLRRDHQCCTATGCRNVLYLDLHHVQLSSEGGRNEASNLITLCSVHHRAAHRGELVITGTAATGVRFRHADGSDYGQAFKPRAVEIQAKAFATLRRLGFREGETRRVLAKICDNDGAQETSLERVLRDALAKLTPSRANP